MTYIPLVDLQSIAVAFNKKLCFMKVKSYFVLLKLEPFIGKMRQMWQSTNAFAVVQMTCDDMLYKFAPLLAYYKVKIAAK